MAAFQTKPTRPGGWDCREIRGGLGMDRHRGEAPWTTASFSLTSDVGFTSREKKVRVNCYRKVMRYIYERVRCKERGDNMQTGDKQWNNEHETKHD